MNYWHIQLHPGDRKDDFPPELIKDIVVKTGLIGVGSWDQGGDVKDRFYNKMAFGDVVAVKQGLSPIAIVQIVSEAFLEKNTNSDYDWFIHRRKVEVLDTYQRAYNFSIPQTRGTLSFCENLETATSQVIINWYRSAIKKILMNNINLSEERQSELKNLWLKFKGDNNQNGIDSINKEINSLLDKWSVYKEKILNDSFNLEEYTNRKSEIETVPGYYLCNFLERTTRNVFGSSKPGNANNFEIKLNSDGATYTFREDLKKGDKENKNSKEEALKAFENSIKPLLRKIVKTTTASDKIGLVENSKYSAKQVLRKLAVLDHLNDFLFIYSDAVIDALHGEFLSSDETTNLGQNHELRIVLNKLLNIENTATDAVLLSRFMWKYANSHGIADKNSPNVILYGPPGTGKTYAVKTSLDFICQGDRSRYEFVQFHPSFTYEDFIEGIKPKGVTVDGNIKFELVDGIFKSFCKKAKANPLKDFYFVVDEINRANLSSVFGETLLCIEKDYRHNVLANDDESLIKTQYSTLIEEMIKDNSDNESLAYHYQDGNAYFGVPSNVFFIGMMNDVDKSIDAFDLALRRRFKWIRKDCDYDVIEQETKYRNGEDFCNMAEYLKACTRLNNYISNDLGLGKSYEFGHSFFMKMTSIANRKEISATNISTLFNLHLRPTLKEYMRAMYAESDLDKKLDEALSKFIEPLKSKL